MRRLMIALVLSAAALLPATNAAAGQQSASTFYCTAIYPRSPIPPHLPDTSQDPLGYYCSGNLAGARASSTSTDFASFSFWASTTGSSASFSASYQGQSFSCVVPSTVLPAWTAIQEGRGYFYVHMDAYGTCDNVNVSNSSNYVNY